MSKDKQNKENENIDNVKITDETTNYTNKYDNEIKACKFKKYIDTRRDKKISPMLFVVIIGICIGFYVGIDVGRKLPATHKSYTKSQVLATIGNIKITGKDFSKRMEPYFYSKGLKKLSNEEIELQEVNTMNYMTNLEALYKAGKDANITATNDEVDNNYSKIMSSIESSFNLTENEFLKKFDLTKGYIKESFKKEIIANKYLQDNSQVSEKEAKNYYNNHKKEFFEVRASHILISNYDENGNEVSEDKKKENKELAEKLLKRILSGESFEDIALENTDDTYTASSGGDLGYFNKGQMDESFEKVAFSLKIDEIYPKIVKTNYGYHIIKKTGERYSDFEYDKKSIISTLSNNKQAMLLEDALEKYDVKINM